MDSRESKRERYTTHGGVIVDREVRTSKSEGALDGIIAALDGARGAVLTSGFEVPGRYARFDLGFVAPPLVIEASGHDVEIRAENGRGLVLLPAIARLVASHEDVASFSAYSDRVRARVRPAEDDHPEETRTRRPSAFTLLRSLIGLFASPEDPHLGLYGAIGYDAVLAMEPLERRHPRDARAKDVVLYLPDELVIVDHVRGSAELRRYDFVVNGQGTHAFAREAKPTHGRHEVEEGVVSDPDPEIFRASVRDALDAFARGDLFEVVLSQTFRSRCALAPSALFSRLRATNPAPYGYLVALGDGEHLVGASPETFVRVSGRRVESCPIAGTIARGRDVFEDAEQVQRLLGSKKDEAELTMCTDVDRNDKARICEPGSVRVVERRRIEAYSRLFHTVDRVEGTLRAPFDAIDALLAHAWAVTVTGAPKLDAMQFIEDHEASSRRFYAGAVGYLGFDGSMDTAICIRTIHLRAGVAEVRAGATLLHASDPHEEELECRTKAAALLAVAREERVPVRVEHVGSRVGEGKRIMLVDHRDSFVHTLGDYLRRTGAEVVTYRAGFSHALVDRIRPDLAVLSPGPGRPRDFDVGGTLGAFIARAVPVFGVCLGLQGIVEHFGGALDVLETPFHGRSTEVRVSGGKLFAGLPDRFRVGRYHSLHARTKAVPACLAVTAMSEDGIVMAVEHHVLPIHAVQFHPESILTPVPVGLGILENVLAA